jgi:hypothetical protein
VGDRASQTLVIGGASTGAANDLSGATELAIKMVRDWGLSARLGACQDGCRLLTPGRLSVAHRSGRARKFAKDRELVVTASLMVLPLVCDAVSALECRRRTIVLDHGEGVASADDLGPGSASY